MSDDARAAVGEVARQSYGRLVAHLASGSRDLAGAEDALSEAFLAALRTWPDTGVPQHPEAWLLTVARRSVIDVARRRDVARRALPALARLDSTVTTPEPVELPGEGPAPAVIPDQRLELMFICAHPAIAVGVRCPLMLQTVLGLDAARIASSFLVSPTSMSQRLVRAKAKIKEAAIPFVVPAADQLPERLEFVLDAIYAAYTTGWDDPYGTDPRRRGFTRESIRLARLVVEMLPDEPEARGLLATLLHGHAREGARRDAEGGFVPLDQQDVRRWSAHLMAEAETHLAAAGRQFRPGPYQAQAAIQSIHNRRAVTGETDWSLIAAFYEDLIAYTPSVGARVAYAAALLQTGGVAAATAMLESLDPTLTAGYQPYWVVWAHCQRRNGAPADAAHAAQVALGLTEDPAQRAHLQRTLLQ